MCSCYQNMVKWGIKMKPLNSFVVGLEISAKHSFTENLDGSYPEFDDSSFWLIISGR